MTTPRPLAYHCISTSKNTQCFHLKTVLLAQACIFFRTFWTKCHEIKFDSLNPDEFPAPAVCLLKNLQFIQVGRSVFACELPSCINLIPRVLIYSCPVAERATRTSGGKRSAIMMRSKNPLMAIASLQRSLLSVQPLDKGKEDSENEIVSASEVRN